MNILKEIYYDPKTGFQSASNTKKILEKKGIKMKLSAIQKFISNQEINQLITKNDIVNSFIPRYPLHQLQIDLIDFSGGSSSKKKLNAGNRYGLSVIDVFTKVADVKLLKNKKADTVLEEMKMVLNEFGIPSTIYSDMGSEFINKKFQKLMKDKKILFIPAKLHAPVIERFNQTIKTRINKYLESTNTKTILNVLNKFIEGYNDSYHSTIEMSPNEVSKENMHIVQHNLIKHSKQRVRKQIKIGDVVRVLKKYNNTRKGYEPKYTKHSYDVESIKRMKDVNFYKLSNGKQYLKSQLKLSNISEKNTTQADIEGTIEGFLKTDLPFRQREEKPIESFETITSRNTRKKIQIKPGSRVSVPVIIIDPIWARSVFGKEAKNVKYEGVIQKKQGLRWKIKLDEGSELLLDQKRVIKYLI